MRTKLKELDKYWYTHTVSCSSMYLFLHVLDLETVKNFQFIYWILQYFSSDFDSLSKGHSCAFLSELISMIHRGSTNNNEYWAA